MAILKDLAVRSAKPKAVAYKMSDGAGLYLYVSPTGGKLWRWDYRFDRKGKTMAFGRYPDVTLVLARGKHAANRELLATGVDPMVHRKAVKIEDKMTSESAFVNVAEKWLAHWQHGKSARHVETTRRRLTTNILPHLEGKR